MFPSVVDVAGVNRISAQILSNAAAAMVGMVNAPPVPESGNKRLIAASMFGVTTPCVTEGRRLLEDAGYEVLTFHMTGTGGRTLEQLVDNGLVSGVLDVTTTELADELVGGVLSAGPVRLTRTGNPPAPRVVSVGALDMINFGPKETVPPQFAGRNLYVHNATVTLMRTTPGECAAVGRILAERVSALGAPVAVLLPLKGISSIAAVEYQLLIDNNGDAAADVTYATTFTAATPATGLLQTLTTTRNGTPVATGGTGTNITLGGGGGTVHASLFEDPFFFDLVGFNNGFNFTGADTFAGADVSAIVLEVPSAQLNGANSNIGVWARTVVGGNQVDRMGRPAINTALIPSGMKDAFNQGVPANDQANFSDDVRASLLSLNGGNTTHADQVTALLIPDILTLDTASAAGFLNGRRLQDDVIDTALSAVSNGGVTTDMVAANDVAFQSTFPFLSPPNVIPEPSAVVLLVTGLAAIVFCMRRRRSRG